MCKKILSFYVAILILTTFSISCSSKPSEDEMKNIIATAKFFLNEGEARNLGLGQYPLGQLTKSIKFDKFRITNSFIKTMEGETWYFIEVDYKISRILMDTEQNRRSYLAVSGKLPEQMTQKIEEKDDKWSFTKRGSKTYGHHGWSASGLNAG